MRLYYAMGSYERESNGDDTFMTEVWPDLEEVGEVKNLVDAARMVDDTCLGIFYLENSQGKIIGAFRSMHAPTFGQRVWWYPHDDTPAVSAQLLADIIAWHSR